MTQKNTKKVSNYLFGWLKSATFAIAKTKLPCGDLFIKTFDND